MNHAHARARGSLPLAIVAALALVMLVPGWAAAKRGGHDHHGHRASAERHGHGHKHRRHHGHTVKTMTRNLYLGANLTPAIGAPSPEALVAANGQILREVSANDFPTRSEGLVAEIRRKRPDLVGLQEVALWRTAPVDFGVLQKGPSATAVRYDYLSELMAELDGSEGGPRYEVVVARDEFDFEAPADEDGNAATGPLGADINGRLTMRDVILPKVGAGVHAWNARGDSFDTLLEVPILGNLLPVLRGWTATDARVRGSGPFRLVNTHLEAFQPQVRAAQAGELVAPGGPATTDLPVVLVGDLNSDDDTVSGEDRLAYQALLGAGMVERSTDDRSAAASARACWPKGRAAASPSSTTKSTTP